MKKIWIIGCLTAVLFLLMACQSEPAGSATAAPAQTPTAVAEDVGGAVESAPASPDNGYPATQAGYPLAEAGYPAAGVAEAVTQNSSEAWFVDVLPPAPDLTTVTGLVRFADSNEAIVNVPISLAEILCENESCVFVLDGAFSPHTVSDSEGRFAFVDIPAVEYVLVVGNPEVTDFEIIEDESRKARVWTPAAGEILDMGEFAVDIKFGN